MMWLELIAGWFVGSFVLALVVGKTLSGMARVTRDRRPAPLRLVRPVRVPVPAAADELTRVAA